MRDTSLSPGLYREVESPAMRISSNTGFGSRDLGNVRRLRSLLAFGDLELDLVAFLQALVSFGSDRAVMNENVRPIRAPNEPVAFGVIEPLDGSFQTFHARPSFRTSFVGAKDALRSYIRCILER